MLVHDAVTPPLGMPHIFPGYCVVKSTCTYVPVRNSARTGVDAQ